MATSTKTQTDTKSDTKPKQPWLWNVVLINDEEHTYEYVIAMMQNLFAHPVERAFKIAQTVDGSGRAVCLTTHKEHAELKRDQIHAFGRDPLMAVSKGSMTAVIEPAWGEGEGGEGDNAGDGAGKGGRDEGESGKA